MKRRKKATARGDILYFFKFFFLILETDFSCLNPWSLAMLEETVIFIL